MNQRTTPGIRRLTTVLLVVLCAAMAFGGTFTCKGENNSGDFTRNPR